MKTLVNILVSKGMSNINYQYNGWRLSLKNCILFCTMRRLVRKVSIWLVADHLRKIIVAEACYRSWQGGANGRSRICSGVTWSTGSITEFFDVTLDDDCLSWIYTVYFFFVNRVLWLMEPPDFGGFGKFHGLPPGLRG